MPTLKINLALKKGDTMKYRHEFKHILNYEDYISIQAKLKSIMRLDSNCTNGSYEIRSLYFDDFNDTALKEKINGVNKREKFRIRYYNHDSSFIKLEKKCKLNSLGQKYSSKLTKEEVDKIIDNDIDFLLSKDNPLVKELYFKMNSYLLRPKVLVDYTREPYILEEGNVRITLDSNLRTGLDSIDIFNKDLLTIPTDPGIYLLEVKYDEYLPNIIRDIVQLKGRKTSNFSKYARCRIYN